MTVLKLYKPSLEAFLGDCKSNNECVNVSYLVVLRAGSSGYHTKHDLPAPYLTVCKIRILDDG